MLFRGSGPAKEKKEYTSRREEEEEDAQLCPYGKAKESRTHIVGEVERSNEERDVLEEEMRNIDGCDMEKFSIPGTIHWRYNDRYPRRYCRWWLQKAKQDGNKISKNVCNM